MQFMNLSAAPKVMPHILLYCLTTPEADIAVTEVDIDSSSQYSITFCFYVTNGRRGAV